MSCVKDFDGTFCLSQTVQVSAKKHKYLKEGSGFKLPLLGMNLNLVSSQSQKVVDIFHV